MRTAKCLPHKPLVKTLWLTSTRLPDRSRDLAVAKPVTGPSFPFTLGPLAAVIRLWRWLAGATVLSTW